MLILSMLLGAFQQSPHRTARYGFARGPRTKDLLLSWLCPAPVPATIKCVSQQILLSGFGGRKAPSSIGKISTAEVLRLRATTAVPRDECVRRCAQDDDSLGELMERDLCAGAGAHCRSGARDDKWRVVTFIRGRQIGQKRNSRSLHCATLRSG